MTGTPLRTPCFARKRAAPENKTLHFARVWQVWVVGLMGLALAACSPASDPESGSPIAVPAVSAAVAVAQAGPEEAVLNFSNWTDYMPEGLLEDFERESGIKVNYRTYGSNEDLQKLVEIGRASCRERGR